MEHIKASLESQLGSTPCTIEDTEEIFWLRESDDWQSKIVLGNALSAQYRFRDAIGAYSAALRIRSDDPMLYIRLGGAYLTLFRFDEAMDAYERSLALGIDKKTVAFPMGIWYYFRKDDIAAAEWFAQCLPCGDEMKIAVIYWHTLCCLRANITPALLSEFHSDMNVGHHTAYCFAVSVFVGEMDADTALAQLEDEKDDLNYVIAAYGLCGHLFAVGRIKESDALRQKLLVRGKVWPCVAYLAAVGDGEACGCF